MTGLAKLALPFPQIALVSSAGLVVMTGLFFIQGQRMHSAKVERDAARSTIESIHQQTIATARRWEAKANNMAAQAKALQKDTTNEIAAINASRDAALDELRGRPSRLDATTSTTIAGTCTTPLGGSGAFLFREDAGFLIGEAARADRVRVSLKACYAQYDNARDSLAEER